MRVREYTADVVVSVIECACSIIGHAGTCWLTRKSPLRFVYVWALEQIDPIHPPDQDNTAALIDEAAKSTAVGLLEKTYNQGFQDGQRQAIDMAFVKSGHPLSERYLH